MLILLCLFGVFLLVFLRKTPETNNQSVTPAAAVRQGSDITPTSTTVRPLSAMVGKEITFNAEITSDQWQHATQPISGFNFEVLLKSTDYGYVAGYAKTKPNLSAGTKVVVTGIVVEQTEEGAPGTKREGEVYTEYVIKITKIDKVVATTTELSTKVGKEITFNAEVTADRWLRATKPLPGFEFEVVLKSADYGSFVGFTKTKLNLSAGTKVAVTGVVLAQEHRAGAEIYEDYTEYVLQISSIKPL